MNTPHWTALVIFYVISLHTAANHSDDSHYHTAVNIINCNVVNIIKCKLAPHTCTVCMKMQARRCNNANSPGSQAGALYTLT